MTNDATRDAAPLCQCGQLPAIGILPLRLGGKDREWAMCGPCLAMFVLPEAQGRFRFFGEQNDGD